MLTAGRILLSGTADDAVVDAEYVGGLTYWLDSCLADVFAELM